MIGRPGIWFDWFRLSTWNKQLPLGPRLTKGSTPMNVAPHVNGLELTFSLQKRVSVMRSILDMCTCGGCFYL